MTNQALLGGALLDVELKQNKPVASILKLLDSIGIIASPKLPKLAIQIHRVDKHYKIKLVEHLYRIILKGEIRSHKLCKLPQIQFDNVRIPEYPNWVFGLLIDPNVLNPTVLKMRN